MNAIRIAGSAAGSRVWVAGGVVGCGVSVAAAGKEVSGVSGVFAVGVGAAGWAPAHPMMVRITPDRNIHGIDDLKTIFMAASCGSHWARNKKGRVLTRPRGSTEG